MKWYLIVVLFCISLVNNGIECYFTCMAICIFSLEKCLLKSFVNIWVVFLLLSCRNSLYILNTSSSSDIWFENIFPILWVVFSLYWLYNLQMQSHLVRECIPLVTAQQGHTSPSENSQIFVPVPKHPHSFTDRDFNEKLVSLLLPKQYVISVKNKKVYRIKIEFFILILYLQPIPCVFTDIWFINQRMRFLLFSIAILDLTNFHAYFTQ